MKEVAFYKGLGLSVCASLLFVAAANFFLGDNAEWKLSLLSIILFATLSLVVYNMANRALNSSDKYLFVRIIILNVIVKILLSFALFLLFYYISKPSSRFFIVPFLLVYLIFTIFETNVLTRQSKSGANIKE